MKRRRFIKIVAGAAVGLSLGQRVLARAELKPVHWHGYVLGAEGQFTLYTENPAAADAILQRCFAEIKRLEAVFSLYDEGSELSRLNRDGVLVKPAVEWASILATANAAHHTTNGLFDPTIQPLWRLYAEHFQRNPDDTNGPAHADIKAALRRTGWSHLIQTSQRIAFERNGFALTLNGIAQGYITDRVADILRDSGYAHVLVELGETRAVGRHPEGRPWNLGIKDADMPHPIREVVSIENQSLATSGSYGSRFSADGRFHHLIHPKTGRPATRWRSVSVVAPQAAEADALSTGLSFANATQIERIRAARSELTIITQA